MTPRVSQTARPVTTATEPVTGPVHHHTQGPTMTDTTIDLPDALPALSPGAHRPDSGEACVMEYVALLAGEPWSDRPKCTHPVLAQVALVVNDCLPDERRHELVPLIGRLFGTAANTLRGRERRVLAVRLAVWCARRVQGAAPSAESQRALQAVEAWCNGDSDERMCRAAAGRVQFGGTYAERAVAFLALVPFYVNVRSVEHQAAIVAHQAVGTVLHGLIGDAMFADMTVPPDDAPKLIDLLTGLLDEYDRLTGRTQHRQVADTELRVLALAASSDTTTGHGHDSDPIAHALDTAVRVLHEHRRAPDGHCAAGCDTWPCAPELTAEHNVEVLAS